MKKKSKPAAKKPKTKADAPSLRDLGTKHLQEISEEITFIVSERVKVDPEAVRALAVIAISATRTLEEAARANLDLFKAYARQNMRWPVLSSTHTDFKNRTDEYLKSLEIGLASGAAGLSGQGKHRASIHSDANNAVCKYYARLVDFWSEQTFHNVHSAILFDGERLFQPSAELRKMIQELGDFSDCSTENNQAWFNALWKLVMEIFDNHPEENPGLRQLGIYKQNHTSTAEPGSKTSESNIRSGIKDRFRKSFFSLRIPLKK